MKNLVFSFLVVFSSIAFGQSGFNPPKTIINEPLKVENIGLDTVFFANDSIRVFSTIDGLFIEILDTLSENNKSLRDILDTLSDQNTILKDYFSKQENDCIGSNETYYINGTNTITLNASEVCSYTFTVLEEKLQYSENGVSSPFDLPVGYSGSTSFKNGSKFLINQVSFTGTTANSKAIIKVIK